MNGVIKTAACVKHAVANGYGTERGIHAGSSRIQAERHSYWK